MSTCAVFVPVLDRPQRAEPLVRSLLESGADATLYFLCTPGDDAQIAACLDARSSDSVVVLLMPFEQAPGDWARKLNYAIGVTTEPWMLLGADDLVFHRDWLNNALGCHGRSGACVIGTNDLGNYRVVNAWHSTHPMLSRAYVECGTIDDPTRVLHEGYHHNYCDDEFVQTAMFRETYAHAVDAVIEHLHPDWGKGEWDDTYRLGKARMLDDKGHYESRRHLWGAPGITDANWKR